MRTARERRALGFRGGLGPHRLRHSSGRQLRARLGPGLEAGDLGILGADHRGQVTDDAAEQPELDGQLLDLGPERGVPGLRPRRHGGGLGLQQAPGQQIDLAGQLLAACLQGGGTRLGDAGRDGGEPTERQGTHERREHRQRPEHDERQEPGRQQPRVPAEDRDHRQNTYQGHAPAAGGSPGMIRRAKTDSSIFVAARPPRQGEGRRIPHCVVPAQAGTLRNRHVPAVCECSEEGCTARSCERKEKAP
jgi:hypothetical protein